MAKPKVMVIGVDGAVLPMVESWIAEGKLPTFARLASRGAIGHLRSVPNLNSAPSWTSIVTGVNPGKHGIFNFQHGVPGQFRVRTVNGSFRRAPALWRHLGDAGAKVGFLNVPMTFPAEQVNGFVVSGLDTPGFLSPGWAYPKSLETELPREAPGYVIDMNFEPHFRKGRRGLFEAVREMQRMAECRGRAARYLLDRYEPDFFMVVFTATDRVQHMYWQYLDPEHRQYEPDEAEHLGPAVLRVYQQVDVEISRLVDHVGPDTHVILLSDHGFGRTTGAMPYLNILLRHAGLQRLREGVAETEGAGRGLGLLARAKRWMINNLSRRQIEWASKLASGMRGHVQQTLFYPPVDWSATRAYFPRLRQEAWVNLRGREPLGCVEPGAEQDAVVDQVVDLFDRWHDPDTGRKVVESVTRRADNYWGPFADQAADVTVRPDFDVNVTGVALKDDAGRLTPADVPPPRVVTHRAFTGGHADNGMVVLNGPGVRPSSRPEGASVYDITPTVLYLMDAPIPEDLDGRLLEEVLTPELLGSRQAQRGAQVTLDAEGPAEYSEEDEALVEQRLRDLGYVD